MLFFDTFTVIIELRDNPLILIVNITITSD